MTSFTTSAEVLTAARKSGWPNIVTVSRIAIAFALAALVLWAGNVLYSDRLLAGFIYALALILFVLAAASDWLDGYLARKLDAVTPLGAALDQTADRLLIACTLLALAYSALTLDLAAAAIIIVAHDAMISGLRQGAPVQSRGTLGKWKAAAEIAGIGAFFAYQAAALLQQPANAVIGLFLAARILIWAAAALAVVNLALRARTSEMQA